MQWRNSYSTDITYSKDDVVLYAGSIYIALRETDKLPTSAGQWLKIGNSTTSIGIGLIDLGVVNAVDLIAGPQTLYTPSAGQFVYILTNDDGFVLMDSACGIDVAPDSRITPTSIVRPILQITASGAGASNYGSSFNTPASLMQTSSIMDGSVLKAVLQTGLSTISVLASPPAWQANHAYVVNALILGPDDHLWSSSGGTSANSIPDFASNEGSTVVDNDITWTDEGAIPTQGSIHLYALVS